MRHQDRSIKLNRPSAHRDAMLQNLASSLFDHESIKTTEAKSKAMIPLVERIITIAKKGSVASKRQVESMLPNGAKDVSAKVVDIVAPRYADRNGGFVTTVRLPQRPGDNTRMVRVELIKTEEKKSKKSK